MANVLKRISARAKQIRKKHPGKAWKTAVKEAGRDYRAGKLRKGSNRKRVKVKRKAKARRRVSGIRPNTGALTTRETVVKTRARVGAHKRKPRRRPASRPRPQPRRRRIGQQGTTSGLMPVVLLGGLGLLAYAVLRGQSQAPPVGGGPTGTADGLALTGNSYRDATAQRIVAWAMGIGMAAAAITKLIQALNSSSDSDVNQVYDSINSGDGLPYGFIA